MNIGKEFYNLDREAPEVKNQISTKIIEETAEKTLLITEDAGLERDKNKKLEKMGTESSLLEVFRVNKNGGIEVKDNSNILSGHFQGAPLVPGVILEKLYEAITGIKLDEGDKSICFDERMFIPGHNVEIQADGAYLNNSRILSIINGTLDTSDKNNNDNTALPSIKVDIDTPSSYLLQSDPILLAKSCSLKTHKSDKLSIGDELTGEIDLKIFDSKGNPDYHFLKEGAAQVLSAGVSYIENGGKTLDEKGNMFKMMTFKTITTKSHPLPFDKIKKVYVKAKVIKIDEREITSSYLIKNENGDILQEGIISGTKIVKGVLNRIHRKINTALEQNNLIEKFNKSIREYGLYNYLSIDKNKGKITIKNITYFKLLKSLYLEVYNNVDFAELNKEQFNTGINQGDVLDIKLDGLYKDGIEILKSPKKRLDENQKLREIFIITGNKIYINTNFCGDFETQEEYLKHIKENIDLYLTELQSLLIQEKVKIEGENTTHVINNVYKPNQEMYFDENGIYSLRNGVKNYFFINDKFLINHSIIELNLDKYFSAYSNTEIKINSIDGDERESEIVLLKLAILRLFKKIYGISKIKLINDKLIGLGKIIKINDNGLYIDSEKIL